MSDLHNASTLELLHLYLDGELDAFREPGLFHAVADDPELRGELREFMVVRSVFQRDGGRIMPPEHLRRAVFAGIDSSPVPVGSVVRSSGVRWRRLVIPMCAALLGSLLTTLFFLATGADDRPLTTGRVGGVGQSSTPDDRGVTSPEHGWPFVDPSPRSGQRTAVPQIPDQDYRSTIKSARAASVAEPSMKQRRKREGAAVSESDGGPSDAFLVKDENQGSVATVVPTRDVDDEAVPAIRIEQARPIGVFSDPQEDQGEPTGIAVQVRSFAVRSFPQPTLPSQSSPLVKDIGIGLFYQLSPEDAVGMEAGQEAFAQAFRGQEGDRGVRYEQNPILPWIGGAYRHRWGTTASSFGIVPFVQALGGVTEIGPLARLTGGIEYAPDEHVTFTLGIDAAVLGYRSGELWYGARKFGIAYGTIIKF